MKLMKNPNHDTLVSSTSIIARWSKVLVTKLPLAVAHVDCLNDDGDDDGGDDGDDNVDDDDNAEAKSLLHSSPSQSHTWIVWRVIVMMMVMTMIKMVMTMLI